MSKWFSIVALGLVLSVGAEAQSADENFDVNRDGRVSLVDLRLVTNALASMDTPEGTFPDVTGDGSVDTMDEQALIGAILGTRTPPDALDILDEFGFLVDGITQPVAEPLVELAPAFFRDPNLSPDVDFIAAMTFDLTYNENIIRPRMSDDSDIIDFDITSEFTLAYDADVQAIRVEPGRIRVLIHLLSGTIDFRDSNDMEVDSVTPVSIPFDVLEEVVSNTQTTVRIEVKEVIGVDGISLSLRQAKTHPSLGLCFDEPVPCVIGTPGDIGTLIVRTYDAGIGEVLPADLRILGVAIIERESDGIEVIDSIPVGTYTVRASADDYTDNSVSVSVSTGVRILDVPLIRPGDQFVGETPFDPPTAVTIQTIINVALRIAGTPSSNVDLDRNDDGIVNSVDVQLAILSVLGS